MKNKNTNTAVNRTSQGNRRGGPASLGSLKAKGDVLDKDVPALHGPFGQGPETSQPATKDQDEPDNQPGYVRMSARALERILADCLRNASLSGKVPVPLSDLMEAALAYGPVLVDPPITERVEEGVSNLPPREEEHGVSKTKCALTAGTSANASPAEVGAINTAALGHGTMPVSRKPRRLDWTSAWIERIVSEYQDAPWLLVIGEVDLPDGSRAYHLWIETDGFAFDPGLRIQAHATCYRAQMNARVVDVLTPKDMTRIPGPPSEVTSSMSDPVTAAEAPDKVATS